MNQLFGLQHRGDREVLGYDERFLDYFMFQLTIYSIRKSPCSCLYTVVNIEN